MANKISAVILVVLGLTLAVLMLPRKGPLAFLNEEQKQRVDGYIQVGEVSLPFRYEPGPIPKLWEEPPTTPTVSAENDPTIAWPVRPNHAARRLDRLNIFPKGKSGPINWS